MVVPHEIGPSDPQDPLLLLPIPSKLPSSSTAPLETLYAALEAHLDPSSSDQEPIPTALLAAQMRLITRNANISINASRSEVARARKALDKQDAALKAVEYERAKVREELESCEQYTSPFTPYELEDTETFVRNASDATKAELPSTDDPLYEHRVKIAQLERELAHLRRQEKDVVSLTKDRDALLRSKREIRLKFKDQERWLPDWYKASHSIHQKLQDSVKFRTPHLSSISADVVAEAVAEAMRAMQPQEDKTGSRPATPELAEASVEIATRQEDAEMS